FRETAEPGWEILDLGEAWFRHTGLPFVFAVWLLRPEVPEPERVAAAFREIARRGLAGVDAIAAREAEGHPAGFARRYLTEYIRYRVAATEWEAVALFGRLLRKHGWLPPAADEDSLFLV